MLPLAIWSSLRKRFTFNPFNSAITRKSTSFMACASSLTDTRAKLGDHGAAFLALGQVHAFDIFGVNHTVSPAFPYGLRSFRICVTRPVRVGAFHRTAPCSQCRPPPTSLRSPEAPGEVILNGAHLTCVAAVAMLLYYKYIGYSRKDQGYNRRNFGYTRKNMLYSLRKEMPMDTVTLFADVNLDAVCTRILHARLVTGLKQGQVAFRANLNPGHYSEIENAKVRSLHINTLYKLCQVLDVSADYLLGLQPPTPSPTEASS